MAGLLIFARLLCGETVPLEVTPDATVADVLTALQAARPARHRRQLTFQGTELRDVRVALADVGCGMQAVVHESAARVSDFSFAPELCCPQLEVRSEGKSLWVLQGVDAWAACTIHPPLTLGVEGFVHLRMSKTLALAGIMEYTEGAGVPDKIRRVGYSKLMVLAETYYWDMRWNVVAEGLGPLSCDLPMPKDGHVITLRASIRPGGQLSITAHDGSTSNVPIRFQREGGTASQDSKYAFFVVMRNHGDAVDIVDEGPGDPPFDTRWGDDGAAGSHAELVAHAGTSEAPARGAGNDALCSHTAARAVRR
eukprot:TRINITY_DN4679_c0_g1_i3.p1 TRINITY_DN4679_c0_g1~~TRINITY_DN4679_c0_g1_i3.p1  ORF type:complete len:309 (+),score=60.95 TRINITY_DN4679_c0_g1_i3:63-989(+)